LKLRPEGKPFVVLADGWVAVRSVTSHLTPIARRLGTVYWPGPLTLVLPAEESLPEEVKGTGRTVAVRIPRDPLLTLVLRELRCPVAAPSANLPGQPPASTARMVAETFGDRIDLIVDGGEVTNSVSSTIVDCTGAGAGILRQGEIVPTQHELSL
jgi:L-threonylcarbamoyladenylate synthase